MGRNYYAVSGRNSILAMNFIVLPIRKVTPKGNRSDFIKADFTSTYRNRLSPFAKFSSDVVTIIHV